MRFKQVKDILDWVVAFHKHLSEEYEALAHTNVKKRVKLLLEYLADHERRLQHAIENYELDNKTASVMKTWYSRIPDRDYPETLDELHQLLSTVSTEEVVGIAIDFHDLLINMYSELLETSESESTRELFRSLLSMQEHKKLSMVRNAGMLEDY